MRRIGFHCLLLIFICTGNLWPRAASDVYINIGCMERVKNLNPYLARSEIELVLQQLVFPPLIADSGRRWQDNNSFVGVLIGDRSFWNGGDGTGHVDFAPGHSRLCPELIISPGEIIANVQRLIQLGSRSNFSFNLINAEPHPQDNRKVRIHFRTRELFSKMSSAVFPIVNFEQLRRNGDLDKWSRNDNIFITQHDRFYLVGYSDYRYETIFSRQNTITLAPVPGTRTSNARPLSVKTFPDYNQLINGLRGNQIQVGINISPLTVIGGKDIAWADEQFGRKSILYIETTDSGRRKGLDAINMAFIAQVRIQFKERLAADSLLDRSGWIYCYQGILNENIENNSADTLKPLNGNEIKLLYTRNTVNDRVVRILAGVFYDMGYRLIPTGVSQNISWEKIVESRFDLVMKSWFINTPEFLNLRFYLNCREARRFTRQIHQILGRGGEASRLNFQAARLEQRILDNVPVLFLVRYNTRIAYRADLGPDTGTERSPYFFYNLSQWGNIGEQERVILDKFVEIITAFGNLEQIVEKLLLFIGLKKRIRRY